MIEETTRALIKLFREHLTENTILSAGSIVEIAKLPAIVLNGPVLKEKKRLMRDPDRILAVDLNEQKAVYEVPPRWYDLHFDVNISCESNLDLVHAFEECSRLVQKYPLLTAQNDMRERQYLWAWITAPRVSTQPNISQVFQAQGKIVVFDCEVYSNIQEVYPLIQNVDIEVKGN